MERFDIVRVEFGSPIEGAGRTDTKQATCFAHVMHYVNVNLKENASGRCSQWTLLH